MVEKQLGRPVGYKNRNHYTEEEWAIHSKEVKQRQKEKQRIYYKTYKEKHPDKIKAKYIEHREENTSRTLRNSNIEKVGIIAHYSNNTRKCARCGFDDLRALTIDHINGGGTEHRKILHRTGASFYRWLRMNGYPGGYQVLCHNCQWIKRAENREFRKESTDYEYVTKAN